MSNIDKDRLLASRFRYIQLAHNDSLQITYVADSGRADSASSDYVSETETESDDNDFMAASAPNWVDSLVAARARTGCL